MTAPNILKRRKPWLAIFLSLIASGTGQMYNGQWKKGALFLVTGIALGFMLTIGLGSFSGLLTSVTVILAFYSYVSIDAWLTTRQQQHYLMQPCNRWWVYLLIIALNFAAGAGMESVIKRHHFMTFKVPSSSMVPTLQIGDHFVAEILSDSDTLQRGEIVIFDEQNSGKHFVKRAIGLPGETLEIREKAVFINGHRLNEQYAHHTQSNNEPTRDNFPAIVIGADEYFCMGDNREESYDSRWLGPIKRSTVTARAQYLYFPGNIGSDDWADRFGKRIE